METDKSGADFGKSFYVFPRIDNHQMNIHRNCHHLGHCLGKRESERDVRHEAAVHYIDVDEICIVIYHPEVRLQIEEIA